MILETQGQLQLLKYAWQGWYVTLTNQYTFYTTAMDSNYIPGKTHTN